MHKIAIPQSIIDRVIARRGREHIHDDLDPARTALVVVDMQNAFMLPGVAHALCLEAQEIVPNINRLAQAVRETGGAVVWIQTAYTDETPKELVGLLRDQQARAERQARRGARARQQGPRTVGDARRAAGRHLRREEPVLRLHPGLVESRRGAARQGHRHHPGHRHGHQCVLRVDRARRHDVQLQDRHGHDGNAAVTDEDHNASLAAFYLTFGDMMSTDMLIGCLRTNTKKGLAAAE